MGLCAYMTVHLGVALQDHLHAAEADGGSVQAVSVNHDDYRRTQSLVAAKASA